jgi:hypothetical protein
MMKTKVDNLHYMHTLLTKLKVDSGLRSVQVARAPANYFDLSL